MNVLHLINYPGKGGSEKYILSLAQKLHGKHCNMYIAHALDGPLIASLQEMGIKTLQLDMKSPYDFAAAKRLSSLCAENKIDIVHTHFLRENYISVLSKLYGNKARLVNTTHLVSQKNLLLKLSNKLFTMFNDALIAVCEIGSKQMRSEWLSRSKISVIYNGVEVEYWGRGSDGGSGFAGSAIREELGIGADEYVVVSTARFTYEKGHAFLVDSINRFVRIHKVGADSAKKVRFLLIGDGELLDEMKILAEKLEISDYIIFAGYRNDIKNILHGSDLFVSPSQTEALSMSIIEALASGLAVVATDVGGTSEVIGGHEDCGTLIAYGDSTGFAAAIKMWVDDDGRNALARKAAPMLAKGKFSLDNMANKTFAIYKKEII